MVTRELLRKYLENRCTTDELLLLRQHFEKDDPDQLRQLLDEEWRMLTRDGSAGLEQYKERIWERLEENLWSEEDSTPLIPEKPEIRAPLRWVGAAAVIIGMMTIGSYLFWPANKYESTETPVAWHPVSERKNNTGAPMAFSLSDGSNVILEPHSMLRFPTKFEGNKRVVHLEGKAFFEVTKDSLSPFFVETNSVNVRVLGTSFNVTSFQNQPAEVSVITGKVAVFVGKQGEEMILRPNERVVQEGEKDGLTKILVEEPIVIRPELLKSLFHFDAVPLPEVFRVFEEAYDIRIKYDLERLKHCSLNARLDDQSLFIKLQMICVSMGLNYEVSGTDIVITGDGC